MPVKFGLEIMPWCPRCETWHDSLEDHYDEVRPQVRCDCFFCLDGREHPDNEFHKAFHRISDHLLVAESLDPKDRVKVFACEICGHKEFGAIPA